jgi:hypothetical protein
MKLQCPRGTPAPTDPTRLDYPARLSDSAGTRLKVGNRPERRFRCAIYISWNTSLFKMRKAHLFRRHAPEGA